MDQLHGQLLSTQFIQRFGSSPWMALKPVPRGIIYGNRNPKTHKPIPQILRRLKKRAGPGRMHAAASGAGGRLTAMQICETRFRCEDEQTLKEMQQ